MEAHTPLTSSILRQRKVDLYESEDSLVYGQIPGQSRLHSESLSFKTNVLNDKRRKEKKD